MGADDFKDQRPLESVVCLPIMVRARGGVAPFVAGNGSEEEVRAHSMAHFNDPGFPHAPPFQGPMPSAYHHRLVVSIQHSAFGRKSRI